MSGDRFARARELFLAALGRSPEERLSFLQGECGGDEDLLREVQSLLVYHAEDGSSLMDAPFSPSSGSGSAPRST